MAILCFHSNGAGPMTKPNPTPEVADGVPWSDGITEYDTRHDETYIRLLDADNEGLGKDDDGPAHSSASTPPTNPSGPARRSKAIVRVPAG